MYLLWPVAMCYICFSKWHAKIKYKKTTIYFTLCFKNNHFTQYILALIVVDENIEHSKLMIKKKVYNLIVHGYCSLYNSYKYMRKLIGRIYLYFIRLIHQATNFWVRLCKNVTGTPTISPMLIHGRRSHTYIYNCHNNFI